MVKFAKDFQLAVQAGPVSKAVKLAKKASRYKDTLHFGSYAFAATLRGEDKILKAIFKNAKGTFDIDEQNKKTGGTMLHAACWAGYYKTVKFLLENGANPSLTDNQGNNAIHAILEGWNYLFLNMHGKPKDMELPRRIKEINGHEKSLKAVLHHLKDHQSIVDKPNLKQDVPILLALKNFNVKALKVLLHTADNDDGNNATKHYMPSLHVRDQGGRPLLNVALDTSWLLIRASKWITSHGNVAVPIHILQKFPNSERHNSFELIGLKNELYNNSNNNPMLWNSTSYNRTKLDRILFQWHTKNILLPLLKAGCRYTLTDKMLNTPLHVAAYYGNLDAVKLLVEYYKKNNENDKLKKTMSKENTYGRTIFENAAIGGHVSMQKFFKESKLFINAKELNGPKSARKAFVYYQSSSSDKKGEIAADQLMHEGRKESVHFEVLSDSNIVEERIGGWRSNTKLTVKNLPERHCDLDILTDENKTLFKNYFKEQKPVLLRALDDVMNWPAFNKWTRDNLKSEYSDVPFSAYSRTKTTLPNSFKWKMGEYLEYMDNINNDENLNDVNSYYYQEEGTDDDDLPVWLVDTKIDENAKAIHTEDFKKFEFYNYMLEKHSKGLFAFNNYQFMIAPAKTGASPHFHNSALNLLVFGEKLWLLFPPSVAFYSTKHVHDWFREDLPILNQRGIYPLQCRQQPGDIVYVPDMWGHGVIYTKDSVGMAHLYTG
jgi:ankyrin repeat protein